MQERDDVEVAGMRVDVQACLLNRGHNLRHGPENQCMQTQRKQGRETLETCIPGSNRYAQPLQ